MQLASNPSTSVASSRDKIVTCGINPNKALWEKGDFTRLAETMRGSGEEFVRALGIVPRMRVLDLGCGDGTTALPAAQLGADVLGVDIASNLVEAGRARAAASGLSNLYFEEGDASQLTAIEDDRFDLVVSVFGAMFAPRPLDTAREMVRVTRPGGRIAMANWIPDDPTLIARVLQICGTFAPPPPEGFVSPVTWGREEIVRERLGAAGISQDKIKCDSATFTFRYDGGPGEFLALFRDFYGPTMNAFEAAESAGKRSELQAQLQSLFERENRAAGRQTCIPATYLRVLAET